MKRRDPKKEDVMMTRAALAMCENIDWNVSRVLKKLDQLKLRKDTIVLYFSDNGPNSWRWNAGMKGRKASVDEGGLRSPLHIRWPDKIKAGTNVTQVTRAIGLLPTLATWPESHRPHTSRWMAEALAHCSSRIRTSCRRAICSASGARKPPCVMGDSEGWVQNFATTTGLAGAPTDPLATPFDEDVSKLLKYAFNMNASGANSSVLAAGTGTSELPAFDFEATTGVFHT